MKKGIYICRFDWKFYLEFKLQIPSKWVFNKIVLKCMIFSIPNLQARNPILLLFSPHLKNADMETPLFDEDDSQPLPEYPLAFRGDGWELMMRYPPKKKLMTDRYWKPIYVRLQGPMLALFVNRQETRP